MENGVLFKNFKDLIDKINTNLGDFTDTFRYKRKEFKNDARAASSGILFRYDDFSRDWAINEGGGTEIQYHIYFRNNKVGYGLGFNVQYVPFANDMSPMDYIKPFAKAYLEIRNSNLVNDIKTRGFKEYFSENDLINLKSGDYNFFGIEIDCSNQTISTDDFNSMIENLKGCLFELYCEIFSRRNRNMKTTNNYDNYVKLLKSNHNIILHGAPGTGKTYLAKEIAKAMGAEEDNIGFVQFHPSYDYTDFVEGLRPRNGDDGQIGFERKDGVFKEFCKRAVKSIKNSESQVDNFDDAWDKLIDKVRSAIAENNLLKIGKWEYGLSQTESLKYSSMDSPSRYTFTITKENIYAAYQHKQARPKGGFQKDMEDIVQYLKDNFGLKDYVVQQLSTVNSQLSIPYVFIIDEINRGEISKIFGELFFSIDPGYRGEKGLVQTQYQNLVEEGDIFKKGFFVPENVYIIGTMNDIDRSVESMDFAMRRRFVFKEITAAQSAENMNLGDEARRRMSALNDAISKIDGLGSSYHIGAAYFLKNKIPISTEEEFNELWELRLESLLTEYLRGTGNEDKIKDLKAAYEKGESNSDDSGSDE